MQGVERPEHRRVAENRQQAQEPQGAEPNQHDRPEQKADPGRAPALQAEQQDQDRQGNGHYPGGQGGRCHFQAFHGG